MQGSVWVTLLGRIPEKQHDNLVMFTTAGAEIMVQKIIRFEEHVVIFRGRPMGSTDHARTILLPFDQLNYLAFHKPVLEKDVLAMFAPEESVAPTAVDSVAVEPAREQEMPKPAKAEGTALTTPAPPEPPVPEPAPAPVRSGPPSKSILLARLRARLGKEPSA